MLKRYSDINELLLETSVLLQQIDSAYFDATTNEDIIQIARPKVKSCLEHLRSCLDYVAADLSEATASPKTPRNVYFPYGKDNKIFKKTLNKNLPELDDKYKPFLESIQPHSCGNNWLLHLCKTTNFNKHTELQQQDRKNSEKSTTKLGNLVHMNGGSSITIGKLFVDGVHANPTGPLVLNKDKPVSEIRNELAIDIPVERKYEWVKFILKGTSTDVKDLLALAHVEISLLVSEIYAVK